MSVILITDHNENIYNSTKKATTYHKKSPRYVSKHKSFIISDIKNSKQKKYGVMGLPRQPLPNPTDYLRKNQGLHYKANVSSHSKEPSKLPPVPSTHALLEEYKSKKKTLETNFIVKNIKYNLNLKPKNPCQKIAIICTGDTKKLSEGLEPEHIFSEEFGKTPEYLIRLIKEEERNLQFKRDTEGLEQPKCRYITRDERDALLAGLKENWEELQKTYQGLPILIDTIPKVHRKSKLEEELKQLEKDIVLLERHPYIYVYNDNDLTS